MTASGSNSCLPMTRSPFLRVHSMGNCNVFRLKSTGTYGNPNSRLLIRANIVTLALMAGLQWHQCGNNENNTHKTLGKQAKSSTPSSGTTLVSLHGNFKSGLAGPKGSDSANPDYSAAHVCYPNLHAVPKFWHSNKSIPSRITKLRHRAVAL